MTVKHYPKKPLLVTLSVVVLVLLLGASASAYVGFLPGGTELLRTNKPVDLGVTYTSSDFDQIAKDTQGTAFTTNYSDGQQRSSLNDLTDGKYLLLSGGNSTQFTLNQKELTALINLPKWTGDPISNAQVKLTDGTVEFSGNVSGAYASSVIRSIFPNGNYGSFALPLKLAGKLHNPAGYVKAQLISSGGGDPNGGLLTFKIEAVKVNRMDLTKYVATQNNVTVKTGNLKGDMSISGLTIHNGSVDYYGNAPALIKTSNNATPNCADWFHGGSVLTLGPAGGTLYATSKTCS